MDGGAPSTALIGALGLFERATGYTRTGLQLVTPDQMANTTPCRGWDLRALLHHLDDSLGALQEAADVGSIELAPADLGRRQPQPVSDDLVASLRARMSRLLGAWHGNDDSEPVFVAGHPLPASVLACTGALEVAVHGWDVVRACGQDRPLPPLLAAELLDLAPLLVRDQDRPARFTAAVALPAPATPGDRLLAFVGRRP